MADLKTANDELQVSIVWYLKKIYAFLFFFANI
jgi:hypothetical protein